MCVCVCVCETAAVGGSLGRGRAEQACMSRVMPGMGVPMGGPECSKRGGRAFVSETAAKLREVGVCLCQKLLQK